MPSSPFTLVTFAVPEEARPFREFAASRSDVRIRVTGMGPGNAEAACRAALQGATPVRVLTCGFAGGLDPALQTGDLVGEWDAAFPDVAALHEAGFRAGRFVSVDRVAVTAAEKRSLRAQTNAAAVEMESAVIRRICGEHGIPTATLRVISDTANEDLPLDFNALSGPDWKLSYPRLAWALLRAPGKVPELMRFQRRISAAAHRLAAALRQVIEPLRPAAPEERTASGAPSTR